MTTTMTITPAGAVTVGGALPAGCTASGQVVTCVTATLSAGATVTYDIPVTVHPSLPDGTNLRLEAVTRDSAGGTGGTQPGGLITIARTKVDVEIAKSGPARANPDGSITYTLVVVNRGPSDAPQVFVHDATNGNLTTITGLPAQCPPSGLTVSCNLGTLGPGETQTFEFTVRVNHGVADGTVIPNCAVVDVGKPDVNPDNNISCVNTIVGSGSLPIANLQVTKSAPATVAEDGTIRYTVSVTDRGPHAAENVVISDPLPVSLAAVTPLPAGCALSDATVACTIGRLEVGQTVTLEFSARLRAGAAAGANILNCAAAISHNTFVRMLPMSCAQTEVVPPPDADLAITKSGPGRVNPEGTMTYTLTAVNHGPGAATGVVIRDPLGDLPVALVSLPGGCQVAQGTVTCTAGTLAAGESRSFDIIVRASHQAVPGSAIENCADAYSGTDDPRPGNNQSCADTVVNVRRPVRPVAPPVADVRVHKEGPASVEQGGVIRYTVRVSNAGPAAAKDVTVSDPLPPSLGQVTGLPAGCALSVRTVLCHVAELGVGESRTLTFTVALGAGAAAGTHVLNCAAAASTIDLLREAPGSECAETAVDPPPDADVAITKTAPARAGAGGIITYSLAVTNHGPAAADGVVVHDPLIGLPVSVVALPGGCALTAGTVTCALGTLTAGETTILDITVRVRHGVAAGTVLPDCADVYTVTDDPHVNDNQACAQSVAGDETPPAATVLVTKKGPATTHAGQAYAYAVTVANPGPGNARDVLLSDPVDQAALTPGPLPAGCAVQGGTVTCAVGTLAAGQSRTFVIGVTVGKHTTPGTRIDNCAQARSTRTRLRDVPGPWCAQTDVLPGHAPTLPVVPVTG